MEHTVELTDTVPPTPHDSPLTGGYTPGSDEGRLKLDELMDLCTILSNRVTTLENELSSTKAVYHKAFITLTKRVKKLETRLKQKRSRAVIHSSDEEEPREGDSVERAITTDTSLKAAHASDNILKTLTMAMPNVDIHQGIDTGGSPRRQETMRGTFAHTRSERVLEQPSEPPLTEGHTFRSGVDIKDSPKQGRMIQELNKDEGVNLVSEQGEVHETAELSKDDDDENLVETLLNIKRTLELQRKLDKREEDVDKVDQTKEIDWNDPIVLRYHALQNRPFFKAEVRKNMCMYLKNQGGYKQSYFKGMKCEDIRPIFERVQDQVHTFVPNDSHIEKEVMKRSGFHLQQESSKKQKLDQQTKKEEEEVKAQADNDQEVEEMKCYIRIVPDEEIAIDAIPLATKPPTIIKYKIVNEGRISTYHIIRADESIKRYTSMINLLENIDREDLEAL
nr:hypothetical protein [Tanacetum cinerariifolium]